MSYIDDSLALQNGVSITPDTVLTDPNVNVDQLYPSAMNHRHGVDKAQPQNLANTISGAGNAGALLMIQNVNTGQVTHMTNKFYLQAMDIQLKERVQIMETFGKPIASFFGDTARVYNFSGVALEADTTKSQRKGEYFHGTSLLYLYEAYMRGTKLVDGAAIGIMQVANHSVYGYPLQFSYRAMGDMDKAIQFSLSFFVKEHLYEIPGVIDKSLMQKNVRMGATDNPNVRRLESLRTPLRKIKEHFKERSDKQWQSAHDSDQQNKAVAAFQAIAQVGERVFDNVGDLIKGREADFMVDVEDYVAQVKDMFGEVVPNKQQASSFGLINIDAYHTNTNNSVHWTDGFKSELKLAWQWMPWADTAGAQSVLTSVDENNLQQTLNSDTFLQDLVTELQTLDGNDAHEKAKQYANDDRKRGAYAATLRQMINTVDTNIHRKLQYYYMNHDLTLAKDVKDLVV